MCEILWRADMIARMALQEDQRKGWVRSGRKEQFLALFPSTREKMMRFSGGIYPLRACAFTERI